MIYKIGDEVYVPVYVKNGTKVICDSMVTYDEYIKLGSFEPFIIISTEDSSSKWIKINIPNLKEYNCYGCTWSVPFSVLEKAALDTKNFNCKHCRQ